MKQLQGQLIGFQVSEAYPRKTFIQRLRIIYNMSKLREHLLSSESFVHPVSMSQERTQLEHVSMLHTEGHPAPPKSL